MTLFLLPNLFEYDPDQKKHLPALLEEIVASLDGLICENEKNGRRFLSLFRSSLKKPVHQIPIAIFNKKTNPKDVDFLLEPMQENEKWGYVSDCGLSVIADPGDVLVKRARQLKIKVEAISGPCSITMALQLSGFSGNRFSFFGYLDKNPSARKKQIDHLEKRSSQNQEVIICMETPFRNNELLNEFQKYLNPKTSLCIASNLMFKDQLVMTINLKNLDHNQEIDLKNRPTLFLFKA